MSTDYISLYFGGPSHLSLQKAVSRSRSRSKSAGRKRPSNSPSRSRRRPSSDHSRRRHPHGSSGRHRHRGGRSRRRHGSGDRPHKRHSRSRSRDRHRRRHRRRRSRSKSGRSPHHRHSRSPHGKGGKPRRRSRSRSRSSHRRKSRSPDKRCHMQSMEPRKKPLTYKEQLRQQLIKASKILSGQGPDGSMGAGLVLGLPAVGMMEKPSNLPLNSGGAFGDGASGSATVTPQMALYQTMAAMHQKAQELTGIAVPKYYNPAAVNPLKYAEQVQKRKLLWSKNKDKKDEPGQWQSSTFLPDQDGKQTAKFRKLMGMKEDMVDDANKDAMTTETVRKQEELFQRLDKEYEFARMATHTHRGVGLGFQSHSYQH